MQRFFRKCVLSSALYFLAASASYAHEAAITVEIKPEQIAVANGKDLSVDTILRNSGKEDVKIQVWTCSYPQNWITDSPSVGVKFVGCRKNVLAAITLKPGATYERSLALHVSVYLAPGMLQNVMPQNVTFKLGFLPGQEPAALGTTQASLTERDRIWSNPVTLKVINQ